MNSIFDLTIQQLENNKSRNTLVSSESQIGFFGQASKFSSSALGTSNKGKFEVKKVIQVAALAAKKVCIPSHEITVG